jgi:hypothetical protein
MAISFDTAAFVRSHGKAPKGNGIWGFEVTRRVQYANGSACETSAMFTPRAMSFMEAKVWARHKFAGDRAIEGVSVAP